MTWLPDAFYHLLQAFVLLCLISLASYAVMRIARWFGITIDDDSDDDDEYRGADHE